MGATRGAAQRPRAPWSDRTRVLVIAVCLLTVAGLALTAWSLRAGWGVVPATPAAAETKVMIDVFSGRENPVVTLDAAVAEELYLMLADHESAGEVHAGAAPDAVLGFRGLVVTPADDSRPTLRILPDTVHFERDDSWWRIDDTGQSFYDRVYHAIRPLVSADVRKLLPDSNPPIPEVSAVVPPAQGVTATWRLADPAEVSADSVSLSLLVTRLECSGGKTGELMEPVVSVSAEDIVIRVDAVPNPAGTYTCPGNDEVAVAVTLTEPVGVRPLVDAACLAGDAVRTSYCADGAVRWRP
ncbi:MAG TPA: hypothetical protein PLL50_03410 [Propionicimonas sp.]|nr:hypothetical protein [Propionicimonas sp.]HQD97574.1 hypothetical protein [Propionicimonas sp.]